MRPLQRSPFQELLTAAADLTCLDAQRAWHALHHAHNMHPDRPLPLSLRLVPQLYMAHGRSEPCFSTLGNDSTRPSNAEVRIHYALQRIGLTDVGCHQNSSSPGWPSLRRSLQKLRNCHEPLPMQMRYPGILCSTYADLHCILMDHFQQQYPFREQRPLDPEPGFTAGQEASFFSRACILPASWLSLPGTSGQCGLDAVRALHDGVLPASNPDTLAAMAAHESPLIQFGEVVFFSPDLLLHHLSLAFSNGLESYLAA